MRRFIVVAVLVVMGTLGWAAAGAFADKPPEPPGKNPCGHGNTGKPCKPDPQPDRGKDCEPHGKSGGVNEDHCKGETQPPPTNPPPTNPPPTNPPPTNPPPTNPKPPNPPPTGTTPTTPTGTTPTTTPTNPGETIGEPPVAPPKSKPPKAKPPKPPVGAPTPPKITTTTGKKVCPKGKRLYQGKCHGVVQGSG